MTALAISATGVAAGHAMPDAANAGLDRASEAAGKAVPIRAGHDAAPEPIVVPDEAPPAEPAPESGVDPVEATTGDPCTTIPEANHGHAVCLAAHDPVPDGMTRGEYVRSVARQNHGAEVRAANATAGVADTGGPAHAGKPDGAGKPDRAGKPKK